MRQAAAIRGAIAAARWGAALTAATIEAMRSSFRRPAGAFFLCAATLCAALPGAARADASDDILGPGYWRLALSPFAQHYRYSAEHKPVWAIGFERQRDDDWLAGASYFSNSFGQPSAYLYLGKRFPALFGIQKLFGQASGGLLYGYKAPYENKVPLNHNGYSPGALVSLGWQFDKQSSITAHALGDAGVMIQFSYELR